MEKKDKIESIITQLAQFLVGGPESVDPESDAPLYMLDNNQKIVTKKAITKIQEIVGD